MKLFSTIALMALVAATMLLASGESNGQGSCDRGGNHTIQVSEGPDGMPALRYRGGSAEDVHVCKGDQVQWVRDAVRPAASFRSRSMQAPVNTTTA